MRNIAFLIPYFGPFPAYFDTWCITAANLSDQGVHFYLITDNEVAINSDNIHIIRMSFSDFREKVQDRFNFTVSLNEPYKICDFKPAMGYIFEDIIKDYSFWGNCDLDMIWGDFNTFVNNELLNTYQRLFFLGHCTIYMNNQTLNTLFMRKGAMVNYRKVFSSPEIFGFDEYTGMLKIALRNGITNYFGTPYADLKTAYSRMVIHEKPNYTYQIMCWKQGHVYRYYVDENGKMGVDEFLYCHFQKKQPQSNTNSFDKNKQMIVFSSKRFLVVDMDCIDEEFIKNHSDFISNERDDSELRVWKSNRRKRFQSYSFSRKLFAVRKSVMTRIMLRKVGI